MYFRRVIATPVRAGDLLPGELFSAVGPVHWEDALNTRSVGEKCYIRTNTPADAADDADVIVYRLAIVPIIESGGASDDGVDSLRS